MSRTRCTPCTGKAPLPSSFAAFYAVKAARKEAELVQKGHLIRLKVTPTIQSPEFSSLL